MNPILSMFGNFQNFQNQFSTFQQQMSGTDPRQKVQELLNSGHSIKDRMIDKLESMYDEAKTDHERQIVDEWIARLNSN